MGEIPQLVDGAFEVLEAGIGVGNWLNTSADQRGPLLRKVRPSWLKSQPADSTELIEARQLFSHL